MQNIYIGPNVSSIHPIFKYGNNYGTITIDASNPNYSIENNELYNKDKTELLGVYHEITGEYIVREGITKIGDMAFHNKRGMTSIQLPNSLKEIGRAFNYCIGLTSIYIPNSVETIGASAFANADNLQQIQIDKAPGEITGSPWGAIRGDRIVEWLRN